MEMNSVIKITGLESDEFDVELESDDITRNNSTPITRSTMAMNPVNIFT
jgi:hypothetical protein